MKILVTGANGFVGRHIVEYFGACGYDVRASTRRNVRPSDTMASWVGAPDLDADADWTSQVAGVEVIVHCAARVHVMREGSNDAVGEFRRVNCDGTMALARAAAAAGVKRFIFLSSIKVNGESTPLDRPFHADDEPRPLDPYAKSKLEAERALFAFSHDSGMDAVIIRPPLIYGPGVGANFLAMMQLMQKRIPLPLGAVNNRRSLLFVRNLASLIHRAAEHDAAANKVFLASDGIDLSTTDMLRMLATSMGKSARLFPVPTSAMSFALRLVRNEAIARRLFGSLVVDIQATRKVLEWEPPVTVAQGFDETVAAYSMHRQTAK